MSATKMRATYYLIPVGLDRDDPRVTPWEETIVQKVQPHGCPRNGTMGMVYVQHALSGQFIGLVHAASLVKSGNVEPFRDLAAEARDRRVRR